MLAQNITDVTICPCHQPVSRLTPAHGSCVLCLTAAEVPRREKSLGVLSQRFIQLFLIADALGRRMVLPLEEAARLLRGMDQATGKPLEDDSNDGSAKRLKSTWRGCWGAGMLVILSLLRRPLPAC